MRMWNRMRDVDHVPNFGTDDVPNFGADGTYNIPNAVPNVLTNQYTNGGTKPSPDGISYESTNHEPHHILPDAVSIVFANKHTNSGTNSSPDREPHCLAYIRSNHHSHAD